MTLHRTAAFKRTLTITQLLLAGAAAVIILTITACSGEQPQPTNRPQTEDRSPGQTIEAMSQEITALQTQVAMVRETSEAEEPKGTEQPVPTTRAETPQPTSPPPQASIATPSGPGICGRSPEIQRDILETLEAPLCQVISIPELFRITDLPQMGMTTIRAGDFAGMVNLQELEISAQHVEAEAFAGLDNLTQMTLTTIADGSITQGAFQGLNALESLEISWPKPDGDAEETLTLPEFDSMPSLKHLEIELRIPTFRADQLATLFKNLNSLEDVLIILHVSNPDVQEIPLPSETLRQNPKLESLRIGANTEQITFYLPEDFLAENRELKDVSIGKATGYSGSFRVHEYTFSQLEKLETLRVNGYLKERKWHYNELKLHESSPLFNIITYGDHRPEGFELVKDK